MPKRWKKIQWSERSRLLLSLGLCAALFLTAALLPLAFRTRNAGSGTDEAVLPLEAKAALFADYWYGGGESVDVEKVEHPGSRMSAFCQEQMDALTAAAIDDMALTDLSPTGSEYTVVSRGGTRLRLCRMWLQARGDWQNWMDVCFDAETGDVYYFYVSRECLTNGRYYTVEKPTVEAVAARLAERWNSRLRYVQPDGGGKGTALLSADAGTICFEISCISYDALIDIRISCI